MGLDRRKQSGRLLGGSTLIVPGQQVYSSKTFPITFQYKQSKRNDGLGFPVPAFTNPVPTPTPTPTPVVDTNYLTTEFEEPLLTEDGFNIVY
jgi:hypothetical protein